MEAVLEEYEVTTRTATAPRALVADDQPDVLEALHFLLKGEGFFVETVTSPRALIEALEARSFDLLMMDLNYSRDTTSGKEGMDLLARIRAIDAALPVVAMTAWGTVDLAVEMMREGVDDFILKPWENERLISTLRAQVERGRARRQALRTELEKKLELEEAREIQDGLMSSSLISLPGFDVAGARRQAKVLGGDYFDIFSFNESRCALCVADVMGKGTPAALLMSNLQAALKATAGQELSPSDVCAKVNEIICSNTSAGRFITLFYAVLDGTSRELTFVNAGHNPPILVGSDGTFLRLIAGGPALGILNESKYDEGKILLEAGDRLVLFTDGVTEATNRAGEEFGEDRLIGLAVEIRHLPAHALQQKIMESVSQFTSGNFQDDATLYLLGC